MKPSPFAAEHKITQMSRYLNDDAVPSFESLERLATALRVTWQWLLVGDDGLKAMGARDPVIIKTGEREFAVASYQRTEDGVALYEVKRRNREIKALELAITRARQEKGDAKL